MGGGLVGGLGVAGLGIGGGLVAMHGLGSINESGANAGNTMSVGGATARACDWHGWEVGSGGSRYRLDRWRSHVFPHRPIK